MKTKLLFCICWALGMSSGLFAQNTWDNTHSYSYDASTGVLSNVVLKIDHSGAATSGFDYNIRLLNAAGTTYYVIYDQSGQGGLGGTSGNTEVETMYVPTITLSKVKGLPAGNYILMADASIISGDLSFNTSLNYVVYAGTSGIETQGSALSKMLNVYPNPTKSVSNFSFVLAASSLVSLNIYDVNGKLISNPVQEKMTEGNQIVPFDMSTCKPGMYFYRFTIDNQVKNGILVKE